VLPDWFDLHALRLVVTYSAVACALGAVLMVALTRRLWLRAGLSVVLAAAAVALVVYHQGPLDHASDTCSYRFLKSDLAVDGCVPPNAAQHPAP
jgi:hypothetical protein